MIMSVVRMESHIFRVGRKLGSGWTDDEIEELLPLLDALEEAMDAIAARPGRES
jgi:hypothetical protein